MRKIAYEKIVEIVKSMCITANYDLPQDVLAAFKKAIKKETSPLGKSILEQCVENANIASEERLPICQDTGLAVFFVKLGNEVFIEGGLLTDAINEGVNQGYKEGYLRKSSLGEPIFERKNTGDNTPAIIHIELCEGDKIDLTLAPKGGGAENMSRLAMLPPSAGEKGVIDFVVNTITQAGGNPCPPTVVGVGLGGTFEKVALLAKKALLRELGTTNPDKRLQVLEEKILEKINNSGVGPQGLGGNTTSFAVHILSHPCHLASLPVAVNPNCHAHRHAHRII